MLITVAAALALFGALFCALLVPKTLNWSTVWSTFCSQKFTKVSMCTFDFQNIELVDTLVHFWEQKVLQTVDQFNVLEIKSAQNCQPIQRFGNKSAQNCRPIQRFGN